MTDKHTLTLDHQVAQSRKVKALTEENAMLLAEVGRMRKTLEAIEWLPVESGSGYKASVIAEEALRGGAGE